MFVAAMKKEQRFTFRFRRNPCAIEELAPSQLIIVCSVRSIPLSQFFHSVAQLCCDRADVCLFRGTRDVVARRANNKPDFPWPRETRTLRPGIKSSIEITWKNAHVASRYKRPDPRFEILGLTCR